MDMTIKTHLATGVKHIFENISPRKTAPCYLVNYDGGPTSVAALREACEMATPGTHVVAVFLDVVAQTQQIDGNTPVHQMLAQAVLAAAIVNARVYGVEIETLVIPCHVKGPALVTLAAERSNATLFLGVDESETTAYLNPFADYVISLSPCKVVLVGRETFENRMIAE
jgi:nucleotide-binding universal stress UspA family protein